MVLLFAVLAGGACFGRAGGRGTADTLPPPVSTTATTAVSYAVPAVIDQAYVAKVMAALDHVYGEAVRHLAQTRRIDDQFLKYLVAIYTDRYFKLAEDAWAQEVAHGLTRLASSPADPRTTVDAVVRADRSCVVLRVERDFGPTTAGPTDETPQRFVGLVPISDDRNQDHMNPTPWAMSYDGYTSTGAEPEDPCRAV